MGTWRRGGDLTAQRERGQQSLAARYCRIVGGALALGESQKSECASGEARGGGVLGKIIKTRAPESRFPLRWTVEEARR